MVGFKPFKDPWLYYRSFPKVINRAVKLFATLDIPFDEHMKPFSLPMNKDTHERTTSADTLCLLIIVMQADARKPEVAKYQLVLATQARLFQIAYEQDKLDFERLVIQTTLRRKQQSLLARSSPNMEEL